MKPFLIIQIRPEDETSDSEFKAMLNTGGLNMDEVKRFRIEQKSLYEINLDK